MRQALSTDAEFRRFFDDHYADVRSYCLRRLPAADAVEAVSETFVVVWRKRSSVPADVRPWLFAIARNVVRNHRRSRMRAERLAGKAGREPFYPTPGPEAVVIRNAEDQALVEAVRGLPEKYAEVVQLWAWEYLSARQVAAVVGCSVSAAEKRLTRGLRKLRTALEATGAGVASNLMRFERRYGDEH